MRMATAIAVDIGGSWIGGFQSHFWVLERL